MKSHRPNYGIDVWRVQWQEADAAGLAMVRGRRPKVVRHYDAMADAPDLWARFAQLDEDSGDDILKFANMYGELGTDPTFENTIKLTDGSVVRGASTYGDWQAAILRFRRVLSAYREHDASVEDAVDWSIMAHCRARFRGRRVVLEPKGVAGAVWLQLATLVEASINVDQCAAPSCDNWFAATKQGRYPKRFCSDACRKRAERAGR